MKNLAYSQICLFKLAWQQVLLASSIGTDSCICIFCIRILCTRRLFLTLLRGLTWWYIRSRWLSFCYYRPTDPIECLWLPSNINWQMNRVVIFLKSIMTLTLGIGFSLRKKLWGDDFLKSIHAPGAGPFHDNEIGKGNLLLTYNSCTLKVRLRIAHCSAHSLAKQSLAFMVRFCSLPKNIVKILIIVGHSTTSTAGISSVVSLASTRNFSGDSPR